MPGVAQFALAPMVAMDLCGVMVLDASDELLEELDELRSAFVGKARQVKGQDERFAFH